MAHCKLYSPTIVMVENRVFDFGNPSVGRIVNEIGKPYWGVVQSPIPYNMDDL